MTMKKLIFTILYFLFFATTVAFVVIMSIYGPYFKDIDHIRNGNSSDIVTPIEPNNPSEPEEFRWVECYARESASQAYDYKCVLFTSDNRLAIAECMMKDGVLSSYDIIDPNNKDRYLGGPFFVEFITKTTVSGSDRIITFKEDLSAPTEYQLTISGDELTFQEGYRYADKPFTRSVIPKFIGSYNSLKGEK